MQKLITLLEGHSARSELERWNLCREYLQVIILKSIFGSSFGRSLVFQGGTCLRICYNLKRYSEDLDFSLVDKAGYSFPRLHAVVLKELSHQGFDVGGSVSEDKVVQKAVSTHPATARSAVSRAFVRIGGFPRQFGFSMPSGQKLAIKLEVDVHPPEHGVRETFFVSRMNEIFPILKYDLPTLFAGKALALLLRPYERGRDFYDLIWFLSRHAAGNMAYLKSGLAQAPVGGKIHHSIETWEAALTEVAKKVDHVKPSILIKDLRPFLEDPSDLQWLKDYPKVFRQLIQYPQKP
jgi:predicted nucleotidyltransferase component of viral defense system